MRLEGSVRRLTIFVDEGDRAPHSDKPLYCEIIHLAHQTGLAGASAFHGVEGYGGAGHVHVSRILSLAANLPVAVVIVDTAERIDTFVPLVRGLVTGGLMTVEDVRAVGHHRRRGYGVEEDEGSRHRGMLRRGNRGSAAHGDSPTTG